MCMKILPIIFCAIMLLLNIPNTNFLNCLTFTDGTFSFYTTENYTAQQCHTLKCGNGYIISCESNLAHFLYNKLNKQKLLGISIETSADNMKKIIDELDFKMETTQNCGDILFSYGYSTKLDKFVTIDGKKINIQIAKRGEKIKIGYPLILDSA